MTIKQSDFTPTQQDCLRAYMIMYRLTPNQAISKIVDHFFLCESAKAESEQERAK